MAPALPAGIKADMNRKTAPACPQCALPMAPVRGERPAFSVIKTFRCTRCDVVFSEVDRGVPLKPERALVLNFQTEHTLQ